MANALSGIAAVRKPARGRDMLTAWTPRLVILPAALASFVYVFVFTLWTLYVSMSNSSLLPTYQFVGLKPYFELWSNQRWSIAYGNLFYFSAFYVVLVDDHRPRARYRHRSAGQGRSGLANDLPLSARSLFYRHGFGLELALQPQ